MRKLGASMLQRLLSSLLCCSIAAASLLNADAYKIKDIDIIGNTLVPDQTIRTKIPYRIGAEFSDQLSKQTIHSLYQLGFFRNVRVRKQETDQNNVRLIIELEEKDRVENVVFHGNKNIPDEKLQEYIGESDLKTIDPEEIQQLEKLIQHAYQEKNYHHAQVTSTIERTDEKRVILHFHITEGKRAVVKRVRFIGNESIPSKELRTNIFTREEWILSVLDKAGTYHPDAIEQDKYLLENLYQSNGFLAARTTDAHVEELNDGNFMVTFVIDEGDIYTLSDVNIEGNEILSEQELLNAIPLQPGQLYSKKAIRDAMDTLRKIWGEYGYVYADVQPSLQPDEENKTVSLTFYSQLGNRMFVDRINVVGNEKTSEKIIRRQLSLDEGDMITQRQLDDSKYRVQALGFFEPQTGVNWRFIKKDDEHVDLDLVLREAKTGRMYFTAGLNANGPQSPTDGSSVSVGIRDLNLFGAGIYYNLSASYSKNDQSADLMLSDNWLFDKPISSSLRLFSRKSLYEDVTFTVERPEERTSGGMVSFGARPYALWYTSISGAAGLDDIRYTTNLNARPELLQTVMDDPELRAAIEQKINRTFQPGTISWIAGSASQDYRNHPYYPSRGYAWNFDAKLALPTSNSTDFSFFKAGLEGHWYTPLIGERNLVLHGYGYFGALTEHNDRSIPYRELFHVGGPTTVRGYEFGQIGPQLFNDSLGGKRAFITNVELLFPITGDGNMRGVVFYDGGASWDTPEITSEALRNRIENNAFEYRHSIGFGFRASSPAPIRVDWGFKLDRKKERNENISKVHITMAQDF